MAEDRQMEIRLRVSEKIVRESSDEVLAELLGRDAVAAARNLIEVTKDAK